MTTTVEAAETKADLPDGSDRRVFMLHGEPIHHAADIEQHHVACQVDTFDRSRIR